ncbi:MAG: hypothetical protein PHY92_04285 [Alphaproteobacteria bacterium]|nr:hypothetical protein [Alphaproteobacteria bacterium]
MSITNAITEIFGVTKRTPKQPSLKGALDDLCDFANTDRQKVPSANFQFLAERVIEKMERRNLPEDTFELRQMKSFYGDTRAGESVDIGYTAHNIVRYFLDYFPEEARTVRDQIVNNMKNRNFSKRLLRWAYQEVYSWNEGDLWKILARAAKANPAWFCDKDFNADIRSFLEDSRAIAPEEAIDFFVKQYLPQGLRLSSIVGKKETRKHVSDFLETMLAIAGNAAKARRLYGLEEKTGRNTLDTLCFLIAEGSGNEPHPPARFEDERRALDELRQYDLGNALAGAINREHMKIIDGLNDWNLNCTIKIKRPDLADSRDVAVLSASLRSNALEMEDLLGRLEFAEAICAGRKDLLDEEFRAVLQEMPERLRAAKALPKPGIAFISGNKIFTIRDKVDPDLPVLQIIGLASAFFHQDIDPFLAEDMERLLQMAEKAAEALDAKPPAAKSRAIKAFPEMAIK